MYAWVVVGSTTGVFHLSSRDFIFRRGSQNRGGHDVSGKGRPT